MIKFACGRCGRLIRVDAKYAGKKGKCPKCGNIVTVPKESTIISFLCGQCGHQIEVPEVHAGKKGKCPKCGNAVVVPARKEKPIDGAEVVAVTCSMCGKIIESAGSSQGPVLECPACGAYLESSSGALSTQSDGSVPPEADEEYGEESVGTAGRSAGPDRRLVVLIAAAAAVVIVGGVVLFTVLRSSGSRATRGSNPLSGEQEVVAADRPAPAVAPAVSRQASEPSLGAKDAEMQRLQFRPAPGTKRTVQLTTKATTSA